LLGDPFGLRKGLAESGVSVVLFDLTQVSQGVAAGGGGSVWSYGGHSDLVLLTDFAKLGGPQGLSLKVRGEGNFGQPLGTEAGSVLPPAIVVQTPVANERNYAVTDFLFTQALSENFAVFAGKNDTLDGDTTAFAGGRGKTQFMNSAMVFNPVVAGIVPYSTYMAGFAVLSGAEPLLNVSVLDPVDHATRGPGDLFSRGAAIAGEARLPTRFFDRPGHQTLGAAWTSKARVNFDQDPRVLLPAFGLPGPAAAQSSGSWAVYWNMDQYLFVDPEDETRGWGFFARYGTADQRVSPVVHFASAGLGGSSLLPRRKADTWGVGYFHAWNNQSIVTQVLGLDDQTHGFEAYYRALLTPYFDVTPDMQIIDGVLPASDEWALVLGVRANLRF
jgi:porin